jgi:hypothetical protein
VVSATAEAGETKERLPSPSEQIQSPAFRRAALESERIRIRALVGVLLLLLMAVVARVLLVGDAAELRTLPKLLTGAVIFLGYEILLLRVVSRWLRSDGEPPGDWALKTIFTWYRRRN